MRTLVVTLIGLSILLSPFISSGQAQTSDNLLSADLLFTTRTEESHTLNTLMRINAQTLQIYPFYVDDSAYIRALSWSPTGDLLATLRWELSNDYLEVCLLTREGILQSCLEDRITDYIFTDRGQNYMATWSENGDYLYFVTDYNQYHRNLEDIVSWGESLAKALVATGQTQEILYQTQSIDYFPPPDLFWTSDLHYVQARQWDFTVMRWASKVTDLWQNSEVSLPQETPDMGHLEFCPGFSPQGQYLTARSSLGDVLTGWVLTTPEGQIVRNIGGDRLAQTGIEWMECPVWQSDEIAFYFLGGPEGEASLFKYTLAGDTLMNVTLLYASDPQNSALPGTFPTMPMRLAPDNATLAIPFLIGTRSTETHILTSSNEWITYGDVTASFPIGEYPIWVPPIDSSQPPIANAGPDQTITASSSGIALVSLDGSGSTDSTVPSRLPLV